MCKTFMCKFGNAIYIHIRIKFYFVYELPLIFPRNLKRVCCISIYSVHKLNVKVLVLLLEP